MEINELDVYYVSIVNRFGRMLEVPILETSHERAVKVTEGKSSRWLVGQIKFVEGHIPFIDTLIKKLIPVVNENIRRAGVTGLLIAKFFYEQQERNFSFQSYAAWWIRQVVLRKAIDKN